MGLGPKEFVRIGMGCDEFGKSHATTMVLAGWVAIVNYYTMTEIERDLK